MIKAINILKNRKYILSLFLALSSLVCLYPLIFDLHNAAYFNIDPEMAYIGNALSYIYNHKIYYTSHPGTPAIIILSFSYLPLRVFAKIIENKNFILWTFENIDFVFVYSRLVQYCIFAFSIFILLTAVLRRSANTFIGIFTLLAIAAFPFSYKLGLIIIAETYSLLFISMWVLLFDYFEENKSIFLWHAMSLLSGFAIAIKYNNIFLVLASLFLVISINGLSLKQKIYNIILAGLISICGFIVGTWPIRRYYLTLIREVFYFVINSGPHGLERSFINPSDYLFSVVMFVKTNPWVTGIIFIGLILILNLIRRKLFYWRTPMVIVFVTTLIINLIYLKYGLSYYLLPGYFLMLYVISRSLIHFRWLMTTSIILILLFPAYINTKGYLLATQIEMQNAGKVENIVSNIRLKEITLWDYAPVKDFLYLWIRGWSGGLYDEELRANRPDLLELKSDYKTVYLDNSNSMTIFDVCWDKLLIREGRAKEFLDIYKDKVFITHPIANTGIWLIDSSHCSKKL